MAVIGLILSTIMIQQCSVNGQSCYIDNFNNSKEYLSKCNNLENVKSLVLNVTKLENIPNDVINRTQSVESVDVSNTSLQYINHTLNLCQWTKLKCIQADDNNITELHANVLNECHQLNELSLARNNISLIYDQAFTGLNLLIKLDLTNNQLKSISAETFKPLTALRSLRLNNNLIQTINLDDFRQNVKLQVLDLSYNEISEIEAHAFEKLKELTTLSIQCNPNLTSLDLSGMDKLHTLDAYNGSLSHLDIPKNITNVNADNNKIMYVSIEPNSTLQNLSLKNNSLQSLANLSLAQQLHELDISSNNISDIDFSLLKETNVAKIVVLENPIHSFNVSLLIMLPKLKVIEISTSRIDNETLIELMAKTKSKGIELEDPNRASEITEVVTLAPVTPVPVIAKTNDTTTVRPSSASTTKASPSTTTSPPSRSNSSDKKIEELMKRIKDLESSLANQTKGNSVQKDATSEHDGIERSLSNLRFLVNCMIAAILVFVSFKIVMYLRANQWSIPISRLFSRTPHVRVNGRRNPFNDSMDPIIEEVL